MLGLLFLQGFLAMQRLYWLLLGAVVGFHLFGCDNQATVIPEGEFTEEQKRAIQAEDAKIADEESHGAKKR